ncbi:MAG: hypothetical protein M3H12_06165, partial [Chromatiales bacterium]
RFHANLGAQVGKLAIDLALPEADGEIDIDGEKQKLKKGDMKFNIALEDWEWCGVEGEDGAAAFLDVYVQVNSTQRPKMRRARSASAPASFDLGDNATMSFSGKVGSHALVIQPATQVHLPSFMPMPRTQLEYVRLSLRKSS